MPVAARLAGECRCLVVRRDWLKFERPRVQAALLSGRYRFEPLQRVTKAEGSAADLWSARDALVLKALALVHLDFGVKRCEPIKPGHQPPGCKRACSGDGQHPNPKPAADTVSSEKDAVEAGSHSIEKDTTLGCELDTGVQPRK
jgi:hypothetical protein